MANEITNNTARYSTLEYGDVKSKPIIQNANIKSEDIVEIADKNNMNLDPIILSNVFLNRNLPINDLLVDIYQPHSVGDGKTIYTAQELLKICDNHSEKICKSFTALLTGVQIQNIKSGNDILATYGEIQHIISSVMKDFADFLHRNADIEYAGALNYLDSLKEKYKQQAKSIADGLFDAACVEYAVASIALDVAVTMVAATAPASWTLFGTLAFIAALTTLTQAILSYASAITKLNAAKELKSHPEKCNPTSSEYDPKLEKEAQMGLEGTLPGYGEAMQALSIVSAVLSLGRNVDSIFIVAGWATQIADWAGANKSENEDDSGRKAMKYLENLKGGSIVGAVGILVDGIEEAVINSMDKNDKKDLEHMKMIFGILKGVTNLITGLTTAVLIMRATKENPKTQAWFGRTIMSEHSEAISSQDASKLSKINAFAGKLVIMESLIGFFKGMSEGSKNIFAGFRELKNAGYTFDIEKVKIDNDLEVKIRELRNQIIQDRKETVEKEEDKLNDMILEFLKNLQSAIDIVKTGVQHSSY